MEESAESLNNAKVVSDSGYAISCSNSQSQRSGSSKSRHGGSNFSGSSGYGGNPSTLSCSDAPPPQTSSKRKDKDQKKKKLKASQQLGTQVITNSDGNTVTDSGVDGSTFSAAPSTKEPTVSDVGSNSPGDSEVNPSADHIHPLSSADGGATKSPSCVPSPAPQQTVKSPAPVGPETVIDDPKPLAPFAEPLAKSLAEDSFSCVISMHDGLVMCTTPSITGVLGFPQNMWLGRSFTDFVHPKDKQNFTREIAESHFGQKKESKNSVFVMLRRYNSLRSGGYGVNEPSLAIYEPFQLSLTFKDTVIPMEETEVKSKHSKLLIISSLRLKSAYIAPTATYESAKFITRHTAEGSLVHVDDAVVKLFGYLPQDLVERNVFDFYHPEDLPMLKEIYENIVMQGQTAGAVFRSKPYRFQVQNGGYVTLETEWSSFINPWSRKLEMITGRHRVLQGPLNPDVFAQPSTDNKVNYISEEVIKESKIIQQEIVCLLTKILCRPNDLAKQQVYKRCQALASFMETLMDEVNQPTLKLEVPQETDPFSVTERDSVMLGEISPHHDYYDSKSSTETPPSYNQLNYNENLHRFFESRPKTTGSNECPSGNSNTDTDQEGKQEFQGKCTSPTHGSGGSGSGSGNGSSGSNEANTCKNSGNNSGVSQGGSGEPYYKPPQLTEAILERHNEDMEKIMVKQHRESRVYRDKSKKSGGKHVEKQEYAQGIKRSVSHSWEGDCQNKTSKQTLSHPGPGPPMGLKSQFAMSGTPGRYLPPRDHPTELWPPFSVSLTPFHTSQPYNVFSRPQTGTATTFPTEIFPALYYIPNQPGQPRHVPPQRPETPYVQYVPEMLYGAPPMFGQHIMPLAMYQPVPLMTPQPQTHMMHNNTTNMSVDKPQNLSTTKPNPDAQPGLSGIRDGRTKSQTKADPSSNMGSIASASVAHMALSECSKKCLPSASSPGLPIASIPEIDIADFMNQSKDIQYNEEHEESSSSSFYSSFLQTETYSHTDEQTDKAQRENEEMQWDKTSSVATDSPIRNKKTKKIKPWRKAEPPWMENVNLTSDLIMSYQISTKLTADVLQDDLIALKKMQQSPLVNEQLERLYLDLEIQHLTAGLAIGDSTSGSSGEDAPDATKHSQGKRKRMYHRLALIYEENAPIQPPSQQ